MEIWDCRSPRARTRLKQIALSNAIVTICIGLVMYRYYTLEMRPATADSSRRWRKNFDRIFDEPDPISFMVGPDNVTFKNKYVIYRCDMDTMSYCGGWANRVKGMITAYLIANLSGRIFKSEMIMPECDLQRFMVPNHVNWSLPISFHEKVIPNSTVKMLDMMAKPAFYNNFSRTDWIHHPVMDSDFLYMKTNYDTLDKFKMSKFHAKDLLWMRGFDRVALNRFLFTRLLKPSPYLRQRVIDFLTEHINAEEKVVCIHLRMGKNPTMPKDFRLQTHPKHLQNVWKVARELLNGYGKETKIFLMSDSQEAIELAKSQDFGNQVFISPGDIIHIELSQNVTDKKICDGLEKVLLEQLVLLHCDSLILSDSGISRMAAYIRGQYDHLYCFIRDGPVVPCKSIDLKNKIYYTRG